jgi:hypothetical protein
MLSEALTSAPGVTVAVHVAAFPPLFASVQVLNTSTSFVSAEVNAMVPFGFD